MGLPSEKNYFYVIIGACGFCGFFTGGRTVIGYCLMLDYSPERYHSYLGTGWNVAEGFILIWTTLYYQYVSNNWIYLQFLGLIQGFITMAIICFIPESPSWLYN